MISTSKTVRRLISHQAYCVAALWVVALLAVASRGEAPIEHVDPYIGSGGHGHVFVGASVPFGAVQLGPNNFHQGWDWCSGYHYSDNVLVGFSHLHLSGTGIPDLGDVLIMPFTGNLMTSAGSLDNPDSGYASRFSHDKESVRPGYYSVALLDSGVGVELTATERVGLHRYRFPQGKQAHIAIDLEYENGGGRAVAASLRKLDQHTIVGSRHSQGWARDQRVYFALKSSVPLDRLRVFDGETEIGDSEGEGAAVRGLITFSRSPGEVLLKVGLSPVSEEKALANLDAEAPGWEFDAVVQQAEQKWNNALGVIQVETGDQSAKRVFQTALYHTMIAPVLFNDYDGEYRGTDKRVHQGDGFDNYSVFSLWDTYRAAHPLFTLTQPARVNDFVESMLAIYDQQGKLPVWHLMGNETDTMVGYHAVPVVVDAYFKGLLKADPERLYEAVRASAMRDERGLSQLKQLGYIPSESEVESVAKAMEYAIDDWCIAQMAKSLGQEDDADYFGQRAEYYRNYFDPESRFMRGKLSDGAWRTPFDPVASSHRKDDYCEGNAWQYLWLVPQRPEGLIELLGGDEGFTEKLDSLFAQEPTKTEDASADISGLIGQYAHGNEPGHHTTYLYAFAGQQWKTAEKVRYITTELYKDQPDGLAGNEDCGQMSAWYIFSSLGIYPVNPCAGVYVLGSPLFDRATINLPDGKSFVIIAENNSPQNLYIQSAELNGINYCRSYLRHQDILAGGVFRLVMGPQPNRDFGHDAQDRPRSEAPSLVESAFD